MGHQPVIPTVTEYLYRKSAIAGVPISGTFELTPLCNMDCKMCYVRLSKRQQEAQGPLADGARWLTLARRAREEGLLYLLITGGEPFLHPQIRPILEGLHEMGFVLTLNSNGTLIDEAVVAWLRQVPPSRINISLYGASDATYQALCGEMQGFARVKRAISLLKKAGIQVKLNISATPQNAADLPAMVEFARPEGLTVQIATYMFPPLRRDPKRVGVNERFSPEEAAWYTAYADYLIYGKEDFLSRTRQITCPGDPVEDCARPGEGIRCRAGKCSFWVSWQGQMLPCGMMPAGDAPNVFTEDFSQCWQRLRQQAAQIRLPGKCADCPLKEPCRACAAMAVTETGDYSRVPEYRCRMAQALYPQRKRLEKKLMEE